MRSKTMFWLCLMIDIDIFFINLRKNTKQCKFTPRLLFFYISFLHFAFSDVSESEFLLATCRPHTVVICAAFSWVDGNEKFPRKVGVPMVYPEIMKYNSREYLGSEISWVYLLA